MADRTTKQEEHHTPAEPPGGGRQDHAAMQAAAMRPVTGPASSDTLAAGGGLEMPGRERRDVTVPAADTLVHEPIPGERDPTSLTHREPGAIGGQFSGADIPAEEEAVARPAAPGALADGTSGSVPRPGPDSEATPGERKG